MGAIKACKTNLLFPHLFSWHAYTLSVQNVQINDGVNILLYMTKRSGLIVAVVQDT